jgi:hypothetical protein
LVIQTSSRNVRHVIFRLNLRHITLPTILLPTHTLVFLNLFMLYTLLWVLDAKLAVKSFGRSNKHGFGSVTSVGT